jgi:hypothetical protein
MFSYRFFLPIKKEMKLVFPNSKPICKEPAKNFTSSIVCGLV